MKHGLAAAAVLVVPGTGGAQSPPADPEQTRAPLALLLAAANEAIPAGSSCAGEYGQRGRPRLRDLLSMRLAYLHRGANVITGSCQGSNTRTRRCQVTISHSFEEVVSSASIEFVARYGKVSMRSLSCVMTP